MKKQFILFFLIFLPLMAIADAVEIEGICYNLVFKAKIAEVASNSNRYSGEVVIPEIVSYDGSEYSVTSIGERAFEGCNSLTSITIPNSVTSIGERAFEGCGLTSITIPNSVTSIGSWAFSGCSGLTSIAIPNSVTSTGAYAFSGCSGLTSVTIPNSVTSIDANAFSNCSGLTSITIPNSVTSISGWAFSGCSGLTSITIPNSVTSIGERAFLNCSGLTSIIIPNSVETINMDVFSGCNSLSSVTFSNSLTSIGVRAFYKCSSLNSIIIPNSVKTIGTSAFEGCSKLTSVTIGGGVETIRYRSFAQCTELKDVYCFAVEITSSGSDDGGDEALVRSYEDDNKVRSSDNQSSKPLFTNTSAFEGSYIEYITLHIPESAMDAYKTIEPWSGFKEIVSLPNYKLTYIVDGEIYKIFKYEEGRIVFNEPEPTKEGYTFSGWSEIPETMPANDVTITGTFTINKYKLTYEVDGEEYTTYEVDYGASITPEPEPTKDGYIFSGWSDIPETMPANDVTITGTFTLTQEETEETTDDAIKITSAGQTTWCSAYDLDFTGVEGLKAYIAPGYNRTTGTIWLMRVYEVPAGEGILLIGDPGDYHIPHKSTTTYYMNMLVGTLKDITINETDGEYTNYYLSKGTYGVGFYKVNGSVDIKANRAYLPLLKNTVSGTRGFIGMDFDDDDDGTTGIDIQSSIFNVQSNDVYYNLQGQRVDNPTKGLYIKNGKKVLIK